MMNAPAPSAPPPIAAEHRALYKCRLNAPGVTAWEQAGIWIPLPPLYRRPVMLRGSSSVLDFDRDGVNTRNPMRKRTGKKAPKTGRGEDLHFNPRPKRILVPLDFSDPSKRAVRFANDWAELFGAHLYLLYVVEPTPFMSSFPDLPIVLSGQEVAQKAKSALERIAANEFAQADRVSVLVRKGKPYEQIIAAAEKLDIDLIIIPTHGYHGLERAILGSTAERVVRFAPCPVLAVRRRPA